MKRWSAYRKFIEISGIDQNTMANLFGEMDEYMDEKVDKLRTSMQKVLDRENVQYAHWIANCESAMTVCEYAVEISLKFIERIYKISNRITILKRLVIAEPANVMRDMAELVQKIHVRADIDFNKEDSIQAAFRQLNKAFCNPENFKNAQTTADEINIAEGNDTIM